MPALLREAGYSTAAIGKCVQNVAQHDILPILSPFYHLFHTEPMAAGGTSATATSVIYRLSEDLIIFWATWLEHRAITIMRATSATAAQVMGSLRAWDSP